MHALLHLVLIGMQGGLQPPGDGASTAARDAAALSFRVYFDPQLQAEKYTGRVYVMLARGARREPRVRANAFEQWTQPTPVFSKAFKDLDPAVPVVIGPDADHYPHALNDLPEGHWSVQAVARRNLDLPKPGVSPGDLYSEVVDVDVSAGPGVVELRLTKAVEAKAAGENPQTRTVEMVSPLLSKFFGREVKSTAWVRLPKGYNDDPSRKYPVLYSISGFGGGEPQFESLPFMFQQSPLLDKVLYVVPDSRCFRGHHVFADSDNNGPRGRALVEELIPLVERTCRGAESPKHRYVTGMSSGGWSSLWLQVTYPEVFNGCWSDVPDPVDFRDFQRINLYETGANMYHDPAGSRRPLMRMNEQVVIWYEDFAKAEAVLGPGGQLHSFEAVFSRRGKDGEPEPLFNRETGAVNAEVARSWERYDIRMILERNWPTLGPKLTGKLHIRAGEFDNFYLEGAARLLKESLGRLGSDADVEVVTGAGHGTLFGAPAVKMLEDMVSRYEAEFPAPAPLAPGASVETTGPPPHAGDSLAPARRRMSAAPSGR